MSGYYKPLLKTARFARRLGIVSMEANELVATTFAGNRRNIEITLLFNFDSNPSSSPTEMSTPPGVAFELNTQTPPLMDDADISFVEMLRHLNSQ